MTREVTERLAARTLELIEIESVGREDRAILDRIRGAVPASAFSLADDEDGILFYTTRARRDGTALVVLAGHVDTIPIAGIAPGRPDGSAIVGRGASDMKGGLAVMLEVAGALADGEIRSDLDVGLLFFGREELPITESALLPFLERSAAARDAALAIVMEPTDNAIEVGCMGNLTAVVTVLGRAAHSARPWLGSNAIHTAIRALAPIADLPVRDVVVDGLVYREVLSVTTIEGGLAPNVVPDAVRAHVNLRYAPTHTPSQAEARLRELLPDVGIEILGNAPPGPVAVSNALVQRLRASGDLRVGPKQAWTPVAEFATAGVDAVNCGPGDPRYAHREDERVQTDALVRSHEILRAFFEGGSAEESVT